MKPAVSMAPTRRGGSVLNQLSRFDAARLRGPPRGAGSGWAAMDAAMAEACLTLHNDILRAGRLTVNGSEIAWTSTSDASKDEAHC